jgi:hypothetical protein
MPTNLRLGRSGGCCCGGRLSSGAADGAGLAAGGELLLGVENVGQLSLRLLVGLLLQRRVGAALLHRQPLVAVLLEVVGRVPRRVLLGAAFPVVAVKVAVAPSHRRVVQVVAGVVAAVAVALAAVEVARAPVHRRVVEVVAAVVAAVAVPVTVLTLVLIRTLLLQETNTMLMQIVAARNISESISFMLLLFHK